MLQPQDVVGSFSDLLEVQDGAFVMFWPRRKWGFGSGVGNGIRCVCHCEYERQKTR